MGDWEVPLTIRVVLGEDNYLVREGVTRALEGMDGVDLVGTGEDLESLRATVQRTNPDVVVTDIRMPPSHKDEGIQLATDLRETHPRVGVVLLSQHVDPAYAIALFAGGSDGRAYLLKERLKDDRELHHALDTVANGRSLVDARVVERLIQGDAGHDPRLDKLSPRERETLAMIAEGRSNSSIAEEMVSTTRAVERHINAIFLKLELKESTSVNRRVRAALLYLANEAE